MQTAFPLVGGVAVACSVAFCETASVDCVDRLTQVLARTSGCLASSCGGNRVAEDTPPRKLGDLLDGGENSFSFLFFRPQIRRDYPLNLSISVSGGKETNKDSLSNGE